MDCASAQIREVSDEVAAAGRRFYDRGWMVGTGGNLSAKLDDGTLLITRSGCHKGRLTRRDFLRLHPDGEVIHRAENTDKPSAETSIHLALYRTLPEVRAVYHVHSVEDTLALTFTRDSKIALPRHEMLKGLGRWEEDARASVPVLTNHQHVPDIAADLERLLGSETVDVPLALIERHGLTAWASTPEQALHHIEIGEFLLELLVRGG